MSIYKYVVISNNGTKNEGAVFVDNYEEAYNLLLLRRCVPISIRQIKLSSESISIEDMLMFFLHMDLQLKCKVRINEAIESFLNVHGNKILKLSLESILYELRNGVSIGNAFEKCRFIFGDVIVSLLKSAEKTGNVSDVISSILQFLKMQSDWKNNVRNAIVRPLYITVFVILILIFSIVFLGPQVVSLVQSVGDEALPLMTQFVMNVLPTISKILLCVSFFTSLLLLVAVTCKKGKDIIVNIILKVPKIGPLIVKIGFWQFCKILQIALSAKLDFMQALNLAIEGIEINKIKNELLVVQNKIAAGYSIAHSFSEIKFIPNTIVSAIYIGEESNHLLSSIDRLSENQYKEITLNIQSLGQNLEDGIKLFAGILLILIVGAFFIPIYNYIEIAGV